jgi:hypothetical protein
MANNYLQFSFVVDGLSNRACEYARDLLVQLEDCFCQMNDSRTTGEDVVFDDWVTQFCSSHEYLELDCTVEAPTETTTGGLWLKSEEGYSPEQAAEFVQKVLLEFDLPPISFTYAATCSKMRVDEFSGGGVVVTKDDILYQDASQWCWKKLEELKNES